MVAAGARAKVDHDHVAPLQDAVRRPPVGKRAALAGGDDGVEGRAVGAQLPKGLLQQEGDIALAQPRPDRAPDPIEGAPGDLGDRAEQLDFVR